MDLSDFGRYLTQQRELRGLSRDEVAQATKIPLSAIGALEEGQAQRLPAPVFVSHFVRAYAQTIGLEPEETVLRYQEIAAAHPAPPASAPGERRLRPWMLAAALALLALGALWAVA